MIAAIISTLSVSTKADAHSDGRVDLRHAFIVRRVSEAQKK